jgi:integrase/recombinase XerD
MSQARVLTERELRKVMLYCAAHPHAARNKCMLLMTHHAGLRVGEVAALCLADVVAGDGTIRAEFHLSADQTKGNVGRTVLLSQKLRDELLAYLRGRFANKDLIAVCYANGQRALFPTQKNPLRGFSANTLCQHFSQLYARAGVDGASSHSGRRFFLSSLADKGVAMHILMALAGHKNLSTTQRYISLNPNLMRAAVELI